MINKIKLPKLSFIFRSFKNVSFFIAIVFFITYVLFFPKQADAALVCDTGTLSDTCTVSSGNIMANGDIISGSGNLIIASGGTITAAAGNRFTITMTGDVTVQSGGGSQEEKLSARVLANFLLRGYSMDEIKRFESFVNDRFDNKINNKEFGKLINRPYKEGGVGLWKKKTERVTVYLESIIDKRKDVEHIFSTIEKNPELSILDEVSSIRNWLIEGYTGKLSPQQITSLDQVVSDRIRGFLSADKIVEILDLSTNKFGVGLSFRAAQLIAEKLELILSENNNNNNEN